MFLKRNKLRKIILNKDVPIIEVINNLNISGLKLVLINNSKNDF